MTYYAIRAIIVFTLEISQLFFSVISVISDPEVMTQPLILPKPSRL